MVGEQEKIRNRAIEMPRIFRNNLGYRQKPKDAFRHKGDLTYTAKPPGALKLTPLHRLKPCTGEQLLQQLTAEAEALRKEKKRNVYSGIHKTRIWFPLLSFFESEVDGIVPNDYEGPLAILNNLKLWAVQVTLELKESAVAKAAGTKLQEGAAMGEYSVVKLVDGIKRNLSIVEEYKNARERLVTTDKNVQACMLDEFPERAEPILADYTGDPSLHFSNPPSPNIRKRFN